MMKLLINFTIILILTTAVCNSTDLVKYVTYSDNNKFRVETIKYSCVIGEIGGETKIYDNDKEKIIYNFDRYFVLKNIYISNDGLSMIYIDYYKDSIYYYKNGIINKGYYFYDIIDCDKDHNECHLLYMNPLLRIIKDTTIFNNSSLFSKFL